MKYKVLLKILNILIYAKRVLWQFGDILVVNLNKLALPIFKFGGFAYYRFSCLFKKVGFSHGMKRQIFKRDNLQIFVLILLFFIAIPQTRLYSKTENVLPGQNTLAYSYVKGSEEFSIEEVVANESEFAKEVTPTWKEGSLSSEDYVNTDFLNHERQLAASILPDGTAVTKPVVFPGTVMGGVRKEIIEYVVQQGDTISGIAFQYGVSVATILWDNNLSTYSFIRPGDKLEILPISGLRHKVISGDTLIKIAKNYGSTIEKIAKFNNIKEDGTNLRIGERLVIPDGVKRYQPTVSRVVKNTTPSRTYNSTAPASSGARPSASGFVWPAAMRTITQYYSWYHRGLDVSGSIGKARGSAIYAAKSGTVEVSQCGWNMGYGCYVIINHGGGYKTLYGHHDKLLVSPGQYVATGQTIGLMGNTGRVYGPTGVHLHFEIRINGWRANPLGYVR